MSTKDNYLGLRQGRHSKSLKFNRSFNDAFDSIDNINSKKRYEKEKITFNNTDLRIEGEETKMKAREKKTVTEKKRVGRRDKHLENVKMHQ
jgi:hypothetical protein